MPAFPFADYREGQREALQAVRDAFADGHRFVALEAPTGSGKSAVAVQLAREARSAYLITVQKLLQEQYLRDFADLSLMKGRANYPCLIADTHAAAAPCLVGRTLPSCEDCPYFRAKDVAMAADRVVSNYAYLLGEANHAGGFGPRELLILDEAHATEGALMRFVEVHLSDAHLARHGLQRRLPQGDDPVALVDAVVEWISELKSRLRAVEAEAAQVPPTSRRAVELLSGRRWLDRTARGLATLRDTVDEGEVEWVAETSRDASGRTVTFRPVQIAALAEPLLFRLGERVLAMSATLLDPPTWMRALGIEPDEAAVIRVPSNFDPERRPLHLRPVAHLTRHRRNEGLPKLVREVAALMRRHDREKGIVHTHTYAIAKAVVDGLPPDLAGRVVSHASAADRESALTQHLQAPGPTVLVTPSMTEGVDLADDAARWQAICKVPYPYLGDPQVAARSEHDPAWYRWRTCLTVVQAYGRSVRGPEDRAVTYLLDAGFPAFLRRERERLPDWFLEAIGPDDDEDLEIVPEDAPRGFAARPRRFAAQRQK